MLWVLCPSWRLLAAACTTALALQLSPVHTFEPTWTWARSLLAVLPPLAHAVLCLFVAPLGLCIDEKWSPIPSHILLAILCGSITCYEFSLTYWWSSTVLAVLFHKYICLRFMLEVADGIATHRPGGCALRILHDACRIWARSWRLLRDILLGMVLSTPCLILACFPCIAGLHGFFLFQTRSQSLQKETSVQKGGVAEQGSSMEAEDIEEDDNTGDLMRNLFQKHAPKVNERHSSE